MEIEADTVLLRFQLHPFSAHGTEEGKNKRREKAQSRVKVWEGNVRNLLEEDD